MFADNSEYRDAFCFGIGSAYVISSVDPPEQKHIILPESAKKPVQVKEKPPMGFGVVNGG